MGSSSKGGEPAADGTAKDVAETKSSPSDLVALQATLYTSRNPTRRWLHRTRLAFIEDAVRRRAVPDGQALEVGPGAGPYIEALCESFGSVVASDIENEYLQGVREMVGERENLELVEDDVTASRLEPGSFDLVLCSEVIEHVADPPAALRGISRLLKPRGTLVLSTPQSLSSVELLGRIAFRPGMLQIARLVYREPVLPTGHISLMTRRELGRLLLETGFDIEEHWTSGMYIPFAAELGGEPVRRLEERLEARLRGSRFEGALWTQYWVARRPA